MELPFSLSLSFSLPPPAPFEITDAALNWINLHGENRIKFYSTV
jgi:hypothetical protein